MILVVFLIPLGIYLLVLGHVNRQARPIFVSGTWDFIGLLFAASGFLLFGGPAVLSSLNESWRQFWLLGDTTSAQEDLTRHWVFWVALSAIYFALVVGGCAFGFWRQRQLTSIYNVEPTLVEEVLDEVCERYGLAPLRSGHLFVFGLERDRQGPLAEQIAAQRAAGAGPGQELGGQTAILEIEPFAALSHVTLRWAPPDSPLRPVLEAELNRGLSVLDAPYHETGAVLTLIGYGVLGLALVVGFLLVLRMVLTR